MKRWIVAVSVAGLGAALVGCGQTVENAQADLNQRVSQATTEAKQAAKAEVEQAVKSAIPPEIQALAADVTKYKKMAQDGTWNAEVKGWIDRQLASANPNVQLAVVPVIEAFQRQVPESRAWLKENVTPVAEQAKGAALPIWQKVLADLNAATPKPAADKPAP